jgi:hypothetical protein
LAGGVPGEDGVLEDEPALDGLTLVELTRVAAGEDAGLDGFTLLIEFPLVALEEGVEADVSGGQIDVALEEERTEQPGRIFGQEFLVRGELEDLLEFPG